MVGGYLIGAASWRLVFFINLPVAVAVVILTARHVPETKDPTASGRTDVAGAALAVLTLSGLTYGLIEGSTKGWGSPLIVASLAVGALGFVAFLAVERAVAHPMLPVGIFTERQFNAANAVTFAVYAALSGALFLLPVELQVVSRYSPAEAGLSLLPVTAIMLLFSARSRRLASRIGPRLQMGAGPLVVAGGLLLTRAADGTSYPAYVLPAVVVFGAGLAVTVAPLTATALGAAPAEHAGAASAINNVVARTAGLIAVAVLPVAAGISGAGALQPQHLSQGFRVALVIAAALCAAGGVLATLTIRNPRPQARPSPCQRHRHGAVDGAPVEAALVDRRSAT